MNAGTQNFNMNTFNLTHFPRHAEIWTPAGGHLGHAGQSCWAQLLFSLWTNFNTKIRKAFLRTNPKDLIEKVVTEEICGLRHLQGRRASFELHVPMSQLRALITSMTGGCSKPAVRCACSPAPAVLLFHSKHCTERAAEPPCVTGDLQHFLDSSHQLSMKWALSPIAG